MKVRKVAGETRIYGPVAELSRVVEETWGVEGVVDTAGGFVRDPGLGLVHDLATVSISQELYERLLAEARERREYWVDIEQSLVQAYEDLLFQEEHNGVV